MNGAINPENGAINPVKVQFSRRTVQLNSVTVQLTKVSLRFSNVIYDNKTREDHSLVHQLKMKPIRVLLDGFFAKKVDRSYR